MLIFNTFHILAFSTWSNTNCVNVKKNRDGVCRMKIYTYNGRNNLCGQRVRTARLAKSLTQQDLAAKLQTEGIVIERDSVSRIEIGTRFVTDYELKKLAKILGVSVDWLLEEED